MKKTLLSAAFVAAFGAASAQSLTYVPYAENALMEGSAVSDNGRYLGGCDTEGRAFIHDTTTGVTKYFYSPKLGEEDAEEVGADIKYVSNDGVGYGYLEDYATTFNFATGEYTKNLTEKSLFRYGTVDGHLLVGVTYDNNYVQSPFYMLGGEKHSLPTLTDEALGFETNGFKVTSVSADGKVMVGGPVDNFATCPLIVWNLGADGKTYTPEFLAADYYDGSFNLDGSQPYDEFDGDAVSSNGKWVAVNMHVKNDYDKGMEIGRYNLETKTFEKITCPEMSGTVYYYANSIADDGTIVGYIEDQQTYARYGMICKAGETEAKYLADVYPTLKDVAQMDVNNLNTPCMITPDGRYIVGFGYIDMNETQLCYATYCIDVQDTPTGINATTSATPAQVVATYGLDGKKLANMGANHRGIVIKKLANGKAVKVLK